ncbi:MAG: trypsin-like peptidase domain-containing protein [Aggregatilineales bacterium]
MASLLQSLNAELSGAIASARNSVVQVRDRWSGAGAGTIWHPDGLIVTNAHVARRGPFEVVLSNGHVFPAHLIARDEMRDLAALAVQAHNLPTIQPGNVRALQPGQWVFAIGHPWGIANAATGGIIIGFGSHLPERPAGRQDWIVVDLHLRPGNSGGPLVDTAGQLIGVNTMITGPNVGIAVSVETVKLFLRQSLNAVLAADSAAAV